jgi:hypothetical protein
VRLDIDGLHLACPSLPRGRVAMFSESAATALSEHHRPPSDLRAELLQTETVHTLTWTPPSITDAPFTRDRRTVLEWGAECIALLILCGHLGWRPIRRLMEGEAADWLLVDGQGGEVAVEVSGTDERAIRTIITDKLKQLDRCRDGERRFAFVVRFVEPEVRMVEHEGTTA